MFHAEKLWILLILGESAASADEFAFYIARCRDSESGVLKAVGNQKRVVTTQ